MKKIARELVEKHPGKFSADFEANKAAVNELADSRSKRLRNRIAGYTTRIVVVQATRAVTTGAGTMAAVESAAEEEE